MVAQQSSLQAVKYQPEQARGLPAKIEERGRSLLSKAGEMVGETNVGESERWISALAGGALALYGAKRRGVSGIALAALGASLAYRGSTGHCPMYQAIGVNTATGQGRAQGQGRGRRGAALPQDFYKHGIHVEESVTVNKSPEEIFAYWRNLENLPRFMDHLKEVRVTDGTRSHWVAKAPAGTAVEWDAEIINEEENRLIAWRSLEGADVPNTGSVRFVPSPGGRGTQVKVNLEYLPPAGKVGAAVARLFGEEPSQQVRDDLHRFKQLMEAGEIPTTEGQSSGRSSDFNAPRHDRSKTAPLTGMAGSPRGFGDGMGA